jgi:hypothetical protein
MKKLPISLAFFTSTKGHWGYQDCYKHTINSISESVFTDVFSGLFAHIKNSGEGFEEIEDWLKQKGFFVKIRDGIWDNHGTIFESEEVLGYYGDMLNLLSENDLLKNEFILFCEDDNTINCNGDFTEFLSRGMSLLKNRADILSVRINRTDCANWNDLSKSTKIDDYIYLQNEDYTKVGPTLTFQPTIMRTRDWYSSVRFINNNWNQFKNAHCELVSGFVMKYLFTDSKKPFAFFNPDKISCDHIGIEEFIKGRKYE